MAGYQTRRSHGGTASTVTRERTTRERADDRRRQADRDEPHRRAYEAGYRGDDPAEHRTSDATSGQYDQGASDRRRADRYERISARRDAGVSMANEGAGFILGLFAYALLTNYLQAGVKGTRAYLSAKFLNKVSSDAAKPASVLKPTKPTTPTKAAATPATPTSPAKPTVGSSE